MRYAPLFRERSRACAIAISQLGPATGRGFWTPGVSPGFLSARGTWLRRRSFFMNLRRSPC